MPTVRATRPSAVVLGALTTGALALTLWWGIRVWQHPPPGPADWRDPAARLCGLIAGYLGAAQVWLAARVPWFEHTVPMRDARRIHIGCGLAFLALTGAHAALAVAAKAATVRTPFTTAMIGVTVDLPYLWLAVLGLLLVLVAAISSVPAVRRSMSYGWWHLQHLLVYPAIAVSFAHQLYGPDLMSTAARFLWTLLHLTALGAVLWYRVLGPARLTLRHQFTVAAIEPEGPGVVSIVVTGHDLDAVGARPGQYFRLRTLDWPMWWHSHPFSLSAAPRPDRLRFTVKAVGDYSDAMTGLTPGRWLLVSGPYGALTGQARRRQRVLLIGGGIGIAPLRALVEDLDGKPAEITLLYRTERPDQAVFRAELDELAEERGIVVHYLSGPAPIVSHPGRNRRDDAAHLNDRHPRDSRIYRDDPLSRQRLVTLVPDLVDHDAYVCGPPGMVAATIRSLRAAGLDPRHIHAETSAL
ncbi:Predicted ferric reductase [Frankia sp. AiPs1]|uniref:ferredoxin reductase family protein n=1 Tax=Frankia sp. AiPa1 TaxID=573492 RepID=UPI00202B5C3C|nr:ferric reductase-like transmembrane domain-containing protein [Frankia sp. AiPa1]MCL9758061.1 ferric reductase-like transmembrane domain-containing protein [Frankia sp. AiPa1]